jgi:hypothetical protein
MDDTPKIQVYWLPSSFFLLERYPMSKIAMALAAPTSDDHVVDTIVRLTGASRDDVAQRTAMGRSGFFYRAELFANDHFEREQEIRVIIAAFASISVPLFIIELFAATPWEAISAGEGREIESDALIDLLDHTREENQ